MKAPRYLPAWLLSAASVAGAAVVTVVSGSWLVGCAEQSAARASTVVAPAPVAPDLHGEPLALLPPGAIAWARLDVAALRASDHFDSALELASGLGADLGMLRRELGFDVFQQASTAAVAIYLPPGRGGAQGWPVLYARGVIHREAVLAAAQARLPADAENSEGVEAGGVAYKVLGSRAYMFPAPDVVLVMDRALVRRVAARLSGQETGSALTDGRFAPLWEEAGGTAGRILVAGDLVALRSHAGAATPGAAGAGAVPVEANALEAFVARADLSPGLTVHAAGRASDEAGARTLVETIDAARHEAAGQLGVRLLRLARVLNEGIVATTQGRYVRVEATATADETGRLLRAASLLHELTGGSEGGS